MRPRRFRQFALSLAISTQAAPPAAAAASAKRPRPPVSTSRHPVPEYAPVQAVLLSEELLAYDYPSAALIEGIVAAKAEAWIVTAEPRSRAALEKLLREKGVAAKTLPRVKGVHLPHGNIWLRDYGPVPVSESGALVLGDFRYESSAKENDDFPNVLRRKLSAKLDALPAALDGGNFLSAGDFCFTSTSDLSNLHERLGCKDLTVVAHPPHAHVDMWMKPVSDAKVLVNELDDATLAVAKDLYGRVPPELLELKDSLNRNAAELSRKLEVTRIPMPLPYRNVFRTYTNAILVNGHALVPTYSRFGWGYDEYPDAKLKAAYDAKVKAVYEAAGFEVTTIDADGMIYNGGAMHCVTWTLPRVPTTAKGL